ncbi:hypothetical protein [Aliiroseovarius sp. YM-037]|uniref:hypothetical protein n=1 Tax=Aliiroseovarius sp. YM-037 TaxID=3341728 RepID=UPI003A803796
MTFITRLALLLLIAAPAQAQHTHGNHGSADVTETGQAQFASIAEIVTVIRDDPSTDWARVDIQALRDHLVDMDNVTTRSMVAVEEADASVIFTITGDAEVAQSIQNMVTAHTPMLAAETGWSVASALVADGAMMTITVSDDEQRHQVLGLGFYGVMTIGAHHQQHHLMIAKGDDPH